MASVSVPVPYNTPMLTPAGTPTNPWAAYFRAVLQGVTGPAGIQGPAGPGGTGPAGAPGAPGARGTAWFSGSGSPVSVPGSLAGDWYLDTLSADVWEIVSGAWAKQGNIAVGSNLDGGYAGTNFGGSSPVSGGTA